MTTPQANWSVEKLARPTGMSVRALHYFDEIELLRPRAVARPVTGYDADVAKLYLVRLLQRLLPRREGAARRGSPWRPATHEGT